MGPVDYRAVLYGMPRESMINYVNDVTQKLSNSFSWLSEKVSMVKDRFFSSEALNRARETIYNTSFQFNDDIIHRVTYESYRPNLLTSRYLMANPFLYRQYQQGLSSDFGGTFIDVDPAENPEDRIDYMNVMDGMYVPDEDGGSITTSILEFDNPLDEMDQMTILDNWDISLGLKMMGLDPTASRK